MAWQVVHLVAPEGTLPTERQRQVAGAFLFGMAFAEAQFLGLTPDQLEPLIVAFLHEVLGYGDEGAASFTADLIRAAKEPEYHDTLHAIIHRGIDGHMHWQQREYDLVAENLKDIFDFMDQAEGR